jgi:hypothetical protein
MSDWIRSSVLGLRVIGATINLADAGSFIWAVALGAAWGHILLDVDTLLRLDWIAGLDWIAAHGRFLWRNGRLVVWLGVRRSWGLSMRSVGVRGSAGQLWSVFRGSATNLRVGVSSGLSLGGGVGLCNLAFFAAGGSFGDGGDFGPASGFQAFGCGGSSGFFRLAQRTAPMRVGVFGVGIECDLRCVACGRICGCGGVFGLGLSQECLLAHLFGSAMSELRTILTT